MPKGIHDLPLNYGQTYGHEMQFRLHALPGADGQKYIPAGRGFMIDLVNEAAFNSIPHLERSHKLDDGTIINVKQSFGVQVVDIYPAHEVEQQQRCHIIARYYDEDDYSGGYYLDDADQDTDWEWKNTKVEGKTENLREYGGVDWVSSDGKTVLTFSDQDNSRYLVFAYNSSYVKYAGNEIYSEGRVLCEVSSLRYIMGVSIFQGIIIAVGRDDLIDPVIKVVTSPLSQSEHVWTELANTFDTDGDTSFFNFNSSGDAAIATHYSLEGDTSGNSSALKLQITGDATGGLTATFTDNIKTFPGLLRASSLIPNTVEVIKHPHTGGGIRFEYPVQCAISGEFGYQEDIDTTAGGGTSSAYHISSGGSATSVMSGSSLVAVDFDSTGDLIYAVEKWDATKVNKYYTTREITKEWSNPAGPYGTTDLIYNYGSLDWTIGATHGIDVEGVTVIPIPSETNNFSWETTTNFTANTVTGGGYGTKEGVTSVVFLALDLRYGHLAYIESKQTESVGDVVDTFSYTGVRFNSTTVTESSYKIYALGSLVDTWSKTDTDPNSAEIVPQCGYLSFPVADGLQQTPTTSVRSGSLSSCPSGACLVSFLYDSGYVGDDYREIWFNSIFDKDRRKVDPFSASDLGGGESPLIDPITTESHFFQLSIL